MFRLLWPILLIMFSGMALVQDIQDRKDDKAFKANGEIAVIEPILKYTETTYKKRNQPSGVVYSADLVFRTKSGDRVTVPNQNLPPGILEASRDRRVKIEYLPERPTTIRFLDHEYNSDNRIAIIAVLLGGLFWFFRAWGQK